LKAQPREEEVELRLKRLRLKEAYLRLSEGDKETVGQEAMLQRLEEQSEAIALLRREELHRELAETKHLLQDTREALQAPQLPQDTLPTFIYSYKYNTDQLHKTSLATGEQSSHHVPSYRFKLGCCWSKVPGGSLLITGGGNPTEVREAVRIDTRRESAVAHCTPMLTPRRNHSAVYHTPHHYILGGFNVSGLSECERYVCAENQWEALPPLLQACYLTSGVVVESSLYVLGGYRGRLGAEVELGKPYLGARAVQAPICRQRYPLFQGERH
jgi:hypothetical protein